MSRKMKKVLGIILSLTILVGILSACGGNKANPAETTAEIATTTEKASESTQVANTSVFPYTGEEIVLKGYWLKTQANAESLIQKEVLKRLGNIKIDWELIPVNDYDTKLQLMLTSADIPDLTYARNPEDIARKYGKSGILVDFSKYEAQMPNYMKLEQQYPFLKNRRIDDGNLYFVNGLQSEDNPMESFFYNETVLSKYNIPVPETLEELLDACRKIKAADANIIPFKTIWGLLYHKMAFSNVFGWDQNLIATNRLTYDNSTKKWGYIPTDTQEQYKKFVGFMSTMWKEQLFDPETFTESGDQCNQKLASGNWAFTYNYFYWAYNLEKNSPGITWTTKAIPAPKLDGKAYQHVTLPYDGTAYWGLISNSKTKYPEMIASYLDYLLSEEMTELSNWGLEGVSFEKDSNGNKKFLQDIALPSNPAGTKKLTDIGVGTGIDDYLNNIISVSDIQALHLTQYDNTALEGVSNLKEWYKSGRLIPIMQQPLPVLTEEENNKLNQVLTPINTYVSETEDKLITGKMDLSEWNKFITKIGDMGDLKSVIDMLNSKSQFEYQKR